MGGVTDWVCRRYKTLKASMDIAVVKDEGTGADREVSLEEMYRGCLTVHLRAVSHQLARHKRYALDPVAVVYITGSCSYSRFPHHRMSAAPGDLKG